MTKVLSSSSCYVAMLKQLPFLLLALLPDSVGHSTWPTGAFILLSLLIEWPSIICISRLGTKAEDEMTRIFFGWFESGGLLPPLLVLKQIPSQIVEEILHLSVGWS